MDYPTISIDTLRTELRKELSNTAQSVCRIGWLLKIARDTTILGGAYADINDFAQKEFGLDKSQVSRFIRINDRFSKDGNSEQLHPAYIQYGSAKLSLMLLLPDEINEELSPEYSKTDIQAIKEEYEEESKVTPLELMVEDKSEVPDEFIMAVTKQLNDEHPEPIEHVLWGIRNGIEIDSLDVKDSYMPLGGAQTYTIRIPGQGRFMVNCKDEEITIVSMREPENKSRLSWDEFTQAVLEDSKGRKAKETKPEAPEKKPKHVEKSAVSKPKGNVTNISNIKPEEVAPEETTKEEANHEEVAHEEVAHEEATLAAGELEKCEGEVINDSEEIKMSKERLKYKLFDLQKAIESENWREACPISTTIHDIVSYLARKSEEEEE